jgi:hypothetical protein
LHCVITHSWLAVIDDLGNWLAFAAEVSSVDGELSARICTAATDAFARDLTQPPDKQV